MSAEVDASVGVRQKKRRRREILLFACTGATILAMFAGFLAIDATSKVWIVNALDVPVDVLVDGAKVPVEAGAKVDLRLRAGTRSVEVRTRAGDLLEEGPFDVPGGYDAVVYNVLGAAPLYATDIHYGSGLDSSPEPSFRGGQRALLDEDTHFVFTEPPQSISIKAGESQIRRRVDVLPGGWLTTVAFLERQKHDLAAAGEICRLVMRAEPGEARASAYAIPCIERTLGIDGQLRFLRTEMARRPDDEQLQLAYAATMRRAGRSEEVRAAYRPRFAANPRSVLLGSILFRVAPLDEARALAPALLAIDPGSEVARRNAAHLACSTEEWAQCAEIYASLAGTADTMGDLTDHARALVATKQVPAALDLVGKVLAVEPTPDLQTSLLYARIAALPGAGEPPRAPSFYLDQVTAKLGSEAAVWIALQLGQSVSDGAIAGVKDEALRRSLEIQRDAEISPRAAWRSCSTADDAALARLPSTTALLLGAELARAGDAELASRILALHSEYGMPATALLDYPLTGVESRDLWRLDPEWRAALDVVRARRQEERGENTRETYAAIERRNVLASRAIRRAWERWPHTGAQLVEPSAAAGARPGVKPPRKSDGAELAPMASASPTPPSRQVIFTKSK